MSTRTLGIDWGRPECSWTYITGTVVPARVARKIRQARRNLGRYGQNPKARKKWCKVLSRLCKRPICLGNSGVYWWPGLPYFMPTPPGPNYFNSILGECYNVDGGNQP